MSIVKPEVSTSVTKPDSFLTRYKGSLTVKEEILAKKSLGLSSLKIYLPFILRADLYKVISTPTLLSIYFLRVVIKFSNEILYIVRFSI